MGTGKFVTVYPAYGPSAKSPMPRSIWQKSKSWRIAAPDVQALISGKIEKGTQGFSNILEVKEDMMLYNAKKYDPDNKLYTDERLCSRS